eukprot:376962-Rhodomonas_salina.2
MPRAAQYRACRSRVVAGRAGLYQTEEVGPYGYVSTRGSSSSRFEAQKKKKKRRKKGPGLWVSRDSGRVSSHEARSSCCTLSERNRPFSRQTGQY